ncbi:MAG: AAA family ATPase [Planctomycetota bacterium]
MKDPRTPIYNGPSVTKLSSVQPTKVRWLWPDRLALGKLTLLAGDPGLGKSYLTLDLAARVSAGLPFPGAPGSNPGSSVASGGASAEGVSGGGGGFQHFQGYGNLPRKVILLSAEDDPADTIRPRLDAAGADCDHVLLMKGVRFAEKERAVNLREDIRHLEALVKSLDGECRLIVIDPISAYLGDDEGHSNTKVRNMLAPLAKLAQDHGVAVLAVTHLNKGGGQGPTNAIYRTMGSLAFTAAARTVHLVARDPADPDGQRRLMLPIKNNLGHDRTGWGFTLTGHEFIDPAGGEPIVDEHGQLPAPGQTGRHHTTTRRRETKIVWDDHPTPDSADALLLKLGNAAAGGSSRESPTLVKAQAFLKQVLSDRPLRSVDLFSLAEEEGISRRTLWRAKTCLPITTAKASGGVTRWYLSDSDSD